MFENHKDNNFDNIKESHQSESHLNRLVSITHKSEVFQLPNKNSIHDVNMDATISSQEMQTDINVHLYIQLSDEPETFLNPCIDQKSLQSLNMNSDQLKIHLYKSQLKFLKILNVLI